MPVQKLRQRRQAFRQHLGHNLIVIVVLARELRGQLVRAVPGRHRKAAEMIGTPAAFGRDVIGHCAIEVPTATRLRRIFIRLFIRQRLSNGTKWE